MLPKISNIRSLIARCLHKVASAADEKIRTPPSNADGGRGKKQMAMAFSLKNRRIWHSDGDGLSPNLTGSEGDAGRLGFTDLTVNGHQYLLLCHCHRAVLYFQLVEVKAGSAMQKAEAGSGNKGAVRADMIQFVVLAYAGGDVAIRFELPTVQVEVPQSINTVSFSLINGAPIRPMRHFFSSCLASRSEMKSLVTI